MSAHTRDISATAIVAGDLRVAREKSNLRISQLAGDAKSRRSEADSADEHGFKSVACDDQISDKRAIVGGDCESKQARDHRKASLH